MFSQLNFNEESKQLSEKKSDYLNLMHTTAVREILESLISQLTEVQGKKAEREERLRKLEAEMIVLDKDKEKINSQIEEMNRMKSL
jgi:hypothetical protein